MRSSTTSPTGSGSAAISRTPSAIAATRPASSVRRSRSASSRPGGALVGQVGGVRLEDLAAALAEQLGERARSAASLVAAGAIASSRDARFADAQTSRTLLVVVAMRDRVTASSPDHGGRGQPDRGEEPVDGAARPRLAQSSPFVAHLGIRLEELADQSARRAPSPPLPTMRDDLSRLGRLSP